jgi:Trk-type K+ transport system membrane component
MAFALWLEQAAPAMDAMTRTALFAYLLLGLVAVGVMLEQAARGRTLELLRLAFTLAAVLGLAATGVAAWPVAAAVIAYLAASITLLTRTSARSSATYMTG